MRLSVRLLVACIIWWSPFPALGASFGDIDLGMYVMGSWPRDRDIYNQGATTSASIQSGVGAGFRLGIFPRATGRMFGVEYDSSVHNSTLSFPNHAGGTGRSDLLHFNGMLNLIVRYPGDKVIPYLGIGAGWSQAGLLNPNIRGRNDKDFETARSFAHQYLAGLQVFLKPRVYVFGEYRYLSSNYHWEGLAMDFRAHYGLFGVGLRF